MHRFKPLRRNGIALSLTLAALVGIAPFAQTPAAEQATSSATDAIHTSDWLEQHGLEPQLLAQQQQPRTALVIGNATYEDDPLQNPINDATDVATALEDLGFEVTLLTDSDWRSMDIAVEEFSRQLQQGGVGVFYYAGHGVQVDGENYLIPIDAELARERDVIREALSLSYVIDLMEQAESEVNVLIIDACRDNPFYRQWRSVRGAAPNRGLALSVPPQGTIISFATEPGGFASDGQGRNSPYTANLLKHIRSEGEDIARMFRKVRADVVASTDGDQVPWYQESLIGSFSLNPVNALETLMPSPSAPQSDLSPQQTAFIPSPEPTLLSAVTGVNYKPLEDALVARDFKLADQTTYSLMLRAANRTAEGSLRTEDVRNFSCEDLEIIDQLWLDNSDGKFGFSVQQQIYQQIGGISGGYDADLRQSMGNAVGWRQNNEWIPYNDLDFRLDAPLGHLPVEREVVYLVD